MLFQPSTKAGIDVVVPVLDERYPIQHEARHLRCLPELHDGVQNIGFGRGSNARVGVERYCGASVPVQLSEEGLVFPNEVAAKQHELHVLGGRLLVQLPKMSNLRPEFGLRQLVAFCLIQHAVRSAAWPEVANLNISQQLADSLAESPLGEEARNVLEQERILILEAVSGHYAASGLAIKEC